MDPSVVGSAQFGELWKAPLPGNYRGYAEQIYSQPLVYTLHDGVQYLFIATTQNNVYKLNAKTGAVVLARSLHVPFLTSDLDGCMDINPTVGITATGVIDP
jgi:outer membrane protein assembly factor BamB